MALKEEIRDQGDYLFKHRSYFPLIFLTIGFSVYLQGQHWEMENNNSSWLKENYDFICLGISLIGAFIRCYTIGYTPKNTSGRNTAKGQIADELNTTGMYSIVRHPLYLGNFFMWLGVAMLTANLWFIVSFKLMYRLYYERIMYAEESYLIKKFKDRYTIWSNLTPAFIPKIKNYKKPEYSFSWKKTLKKEKNGIAAIFLLFWLFEWASGTLEHGIGYFKFGFWFYGAITSGIAYLILKILKKQRLLEDGR